MKETEAVFPIALAQEIFTLINELNIKTQRYKDFNTTMLKNPSKYRYFDEYVRFRKKDVTIFSTITSLTRLVYFRLGWRFPLYDEVIRVLTKGNQNPVVILQHDADLMPSRTTEMMKLEETFGLRSSNYFFVEHAQAQDYSLDIEAILKLEKKGFEIGYHQNAYERSGYQLKEALRLADADIRFLKQFFDINSFVPHGGQPAPDGKNNLNLPHTGLLKGLLWAYNGKSILKEYTWTDGGITKRKPVDPREFLKHLKPGTRAVMLMHPQYYADQLRSDWEKLPIASENWWRKLWDL